MAVMTAYPRLMERLTESLHRKATESTKQLDELFLNVSHKTLWTLYALSPVVGGLAAWLLTGAWPMGILGAAAGIVLPRFAIKQVKRIRRAKFQQQLVDGLLLLSSSLKAGLSLMQGFAVMAEEMGPPISQEFGLVLKETRMGVGMEEAMEHLKERMPSDDVSLFTTAVLVARETGGDVTHLFGRLVETIRERRKLKQRIKTLTFMAQMQGGIMAMLPFVFAYAVYQMNNQYFQFFLANPTGRFMLGLVVLLQVVGGMLFLRFSRSPL